MWRNTTRSWGTPTKLLHWLVAVLVAVQIALGWSAVRSPLSPAKLDLFVWHKSIGMLILMLMVLRVAWRAANVTPALPVGMPAAERWAARASHLLLYGVLLLMPLSGWIFNSASNIPFRMFRQIPVPAIVGPDEAVADAAARAHLVLFIVLTVLLVAHIGAALRHHFVKRDDVLTRMLPDARKPR